MGRMSVLTSPKIAAIARWRLLNIAAKWRFLVRQATASVCGGVGNAISRLREQGSAPSGAMPIPRVRTCPFAGFPGSVPDALALTNAVPLVPQVLPLDGEREGAVGPL